jgi:tetratricopeptide (TPR) repeat protein
MGSKLTVLALQLISIGAATSVSAQPAPELVKKGIEAYKAGRYEEAAQLLEAAYAEDPKPETLFALAQSERLSGKCDKAIPHYKALIAMTTDIAAAKAVQSNLSLCPEPEPVAPPPPAPVEEPKPEPPPPPPPPPPKTIVREVPRRDPLALALVGGGAFGMGISIGLLLRSSSARDDASHARTLDDATALYDRADRDRVIGFVVGGVSLAAVGYGVFRLLHDDAVTTSEPTTEVTITPTARGSLVTVARSW